MKAKGQNIVSLNTKNATGRDNQTLDILKCVSCLIVVCLHCRFPGPAGDAVIYALRFSVPVFFMVSGYYCFQKSGEWILKHLRKILMLVAVTELTSGLVNTAVNYFAYSVSPKEYLTETLSGRSPLKQIFFGPLFNDSLWYLYAMFWTWCVLWLVKRKKEISVLYCLIPVTLILHILGRYYCQNHYDIDETVFLFRSFLLFGLPFTLTGHFIAEYQSKILRRISCTHCLVMAALGHGLIVCEYFISGQYMDLHFSTVLISVSLFLYAVAKPDTAHFPVLQFIGRRLSGYIYYIHVNIFTVISAVASMSSAGQATLYKWLEPVITMALSVFMAWGIYSLRRYRRGRTDRP